MEKFYETNILGKFYGEGNQEMSLWLGAVNYGSPLKQGEKINLAFGSLTGQKVELEALVESIRPNSPGRGSDEVAHLRALAPISGQETNVIMKNPHKTNVFM